MLLVKKFGGTSVSDLERIGNAVDRIKESVTQGDQVVVVVSAMGKRTDELSARIEQIGGPIPSREIDALLSTGEMESASTVAMVLASHGLAAQSLTAWQSGISTNSFHQQSRITAIEPDRIQQLLQKNIIPVIAGFQGINWNKKDPDSRLSMGDVTTLGRGASDTTAVALAAALQAKKCQIYTDVDGVFSSDPRVVSDASLIPRISYEEMLELSSSGAQVLHSRSVMLAWRYQVPMEVLSSFHGRAGTFIGLDA